MSQKKLRNFMAVIFIGLFFLSSEPVFLWLLAGALVLFHPEEKPAEKLRKSKNVLQQMSLDARKFGLQLPKRTKIRSLLIKTYQNFNQSTEKYPHLKSEYQEVIDEMWIQLANQTEQESWEEIVKSVILEWPGSSQRNSQSIREKLNKVRELSEQWDDAKREALGGNHV